VREKLKGDGEVSWIGEFSEKEKKMKKGREGDGEGDGQKDISWKL
jgi:hypothetical protein